MAELLRPLLSFSAAANLLPLRWKTAAVGASQISQTQLQCATTPPLVGSDAAPTPTAVHSLDDFWTTPGMNDGSRMTGDRPVRFCEGLRLKYRGLLSFLQCASGFELDSGASKTPRITSLHCVELYAMKHASGKRSSCFPRRGRRLGSRSPSAPTRKSSFQDRTRPVAQDEGHPAQFA